MPKVYPKCESCSEDQYQKCRRRSDLRFDLYLIAILVFGVAAIVSTLAWIPVAMIICGAVLVFIAFRLYWFQKRMQAGARLIHLLGCCRKLC